MNIVVIGNLEETKVLADEIEKQVAQRCERIPLTVRTSESLQRNYWHVIIMAVNFENLATACTTLYTIKETNPGSQVILISANKDVELMSTALDTGVSHFLVQPVSTHVLVEKLSTEIEMLRKGLDVKRVLAIGAHPDDIEIGCGATLMKHAAKGDQVNILTLTNGEQGGNVNIRYKESVKAAEYLNAKLYMQDLKDTYITDGPETIKTIEDVIAKVKPDIIYTHSLCDNHQDHRNTYYATMVAARSVEHVYSYLSPSCNINFRPLRFEHVEKYMDDKIELINFYQSQKTKVAYLADSLIRSTAEYWGRFSRYGIVEPFEVVRS
jgi:LmbE family N-acetylglucosaminyl deacetylase/CheY-like chemotaxis protein